MTSAPAKNTDNAEDAALLRLKRLRFRSAHRGCKETDIVLGEFFEARAATLTPSQLNLFEALLDEADQDIWDWVSGKSAPPASHYDPLLDILRDFRKR